MTKQSWVLTDLDHGIYLSDLELGPADFTGDLVQGLRVKKHVLRGGLSDGVDVLELDNGALRLSLLPTRGMGIHRVASGDVELGWRSPVRGPVHPKFVNLHEGNGIGWLAGFDEWLCRCGLESNGGPEWDAAGRLQYSLHGRIANLPARRLEVTVDGHTGEMTATGVVEEARLFGRKLRLTSTVRLRIGEPTLHITDVVKNLSSEPTDFELLYHINFGMPFLRPGASLVAPVAQLVPMSSHSATDVANWNEYPDAQPGLPEFVHLFKLAAQDKGATAVLLKATDDRGAVLRYNTNQLPCFTQWKCLQSEADGYVTGLEPGTNYPNVRSYEERQGRTAALEPGQSRTIELSVEVLGSAERVTAVEGEIRAISGDTKPAIFDRPQPGWSPVEG
jgi:galactose mutarotase-like enzyme